MGSKTPDGQHQGPNGSSASATIASINPPKSDAANGLDQGTLEGEGDDEDGDDSDVAGADVKSPADGDKKKKKRKPKKKKKKPANATTQSSPPRVPIANLFPGDKYPEGEIVEYAEKNGNLERTTQEELRHLSMANNMDEEFLRDYRKAAETHRQVRKYAQSLLKPGVSLHKVREEIDEGVLALVGHPGAETGDPLKGGLAFPTGFCVNHIAAHWTPNNGAKEVILQHDDVLSVDFGVHVNGRIVDSAFTVAHNPQFDPLLEAVKAATNTGLKEAGPDARISHISACIQEVMESYEVTINNKTIPVKAVRNITGHNILRYKVHGGKSVPFVKTTTSERMEEGDIFAIETFGTTGSGRMRDDIGVYGYSRNDDVSPAGLRSSSARALLKTIDDNFGTIPFSRASLERLGVKNYLLAMKALVDHGIMESYAPLVDVQGSYVAQFEHTVLLRPNCKEIVSRGDDY